MSVQHDVDLEYREFWKQAYLAAITSSPTLRLSEGGDVEMETLRAERLADAAVQALKSLDMEDR